MQQFSGDFINQIRRNLEADKRKTELRITELLSQDPFSDPERTNDNAASDTEANEESSHDRFAAMIDELKKHVTELDDALIKIGNGNYGFCTKCNSMISKDRIEILPTATLCFDCENTKKKN
jgi:DnaK suppressor protein